MRIIDDKPLGAEVSFHALVVHAVCHRSADVTLDHIKFAKCHRGVQFPNITREKNKNTKNPFEKIHFNL
jgi:hypothetical protein